MYFTGKSFQWVYVKFTRTADFFSTHIKILERELNLNIAKAQLKDAKSSMKYVDEWAVMYRRIAACRFQNFYQHIIFNFVFLVLPLSHQQKVTVHINLF